MNSTHIGRIGALAVALGVGFAIATTPGVACATTDSSTDSEADTGSATGTDTEPAEHEPAESDDDVADADEPEPDEVEEEAAEDAEVDEPDDVEVDSDQTQDDEEDLDDEAVDAEQGVGEPDTGTVRRDEQPDDSVDVAVIETPDPEPQVERAAVVDIPAPAARTAFVAPSDDATPTVSLFSAPTPAHEVERLVPADPVAAFVAAPLTIVSTLVSAVLTPFLAPGPAAPTNVPVLWAVLAWVRREISRSFFNRTPTLVDNQDTELVDEDTVEGSITGTDPDRDTLTYSYSGGNPDAQITVDQQGNWTYTAPETWDGETEYTDSFDITVTDENSRPHLHGLLGLLQPRHTDTVEIQVVIPRQVDDPAIESITPQDDPDDNTGAVTYVVVVTDDDRDNVPPTLTASPPTRGTISTPELLGGENGRYLYRVTYTPDPEERLAAYSSSTPITDTFTLTAADSDPNTDDASETVTATVDPVAVIVRDSTSATQPAGSQVVNVARGSDGTVAITSRTGSGTAADPHIDTVTVLRPGEQPVSVTLPGKVIWNPVVGNDGTVAVIAPSPAGTDRFHPTAATVLRPGEDPVTTPLGAAVSAPPKVASGTVVLSQRASGEPVYSVLRANETRVDVNPANNPLGDYVLGEDGTFGLSFNNGPIASWTVDRPTGQDSGGGGLAQVKSAPVVGADGTAAVVVEVGQFDGQFDPVETRVLITRSDGTSETVTFPGWVSATPAVGDDGTVAVVSSTGDPSIHTLTVVRQGEPRITQSLNGDPEGAPVVGADGTVVQVMRNDAGDPHDYTVVVVRPGDDEPVTRELDGEPGAVTIGADGTVVHHTGSGTGTTVTILRPDGTSVSETLSAAPESVYSTVGDDGTVALVTDSGSSARVLRPGQTETQTLAVEGTVADRALVTHDGTVILASQDGTDTVVTVAPAGSGGTDSVVIPGTFVSVNDVDGTYYVVTSQCSGTSADPYVYTSTEIGVASAPTTD